MRVEGAEPTKDFVTASPDGAHAVIRALRGKPLLLIDVATLNSLRLLDDGGDQTAPVAWSPDSRYVAFASAKSGEVHVYDLEQKAAIVVTRDAPPWLKALSWSPDGERIAAFGLQKI